jgi:capsular exopolysaccharide synthesis family protein
MATTQTDSQLDLRDFISILWVRKWWIIVTALAVAIGSYAYAKVQTKLYTASSEVQVFPVAIPGTDQVQTFVIMANEIRVASSPEVAAIASEALAVDGLELAGVGVENPVDSQSLLFTATSTSAEAAAASANAYAQAYLDFRRTGLSFNVTQQIDALEKQIEGDDGLDEQIRLLEDDLALATSQTEKDSIAVTLGGLRDTRVSLLVQITNLRLSESAPVGQIIQKATTPNYWSSPRPRRSGFLGGFVGLFLGVGLAFLRDRLDRGLRGRGDIESSVDAPVLAMIPRVASLHDELAVGVAGDPGAAEAFRTLRTRLQFAASKDPFTTVMVTSANAGEGKTTTASNLAVALGQTDAKVILVGADLRRPGLHRYFPHRGLGIGDVLTGAADLSEVITRTDIDNLLLVPSGSPRNAPEGGLGSAAIANILARLSAQADYVVVDAPPILGVSDGLDLASLVDGVLIVVDSSRSQKDAVEETAMDLRSVGARVLGVILTHFEPGKFNPYYRQRRHYNYGYVRGDRGSNVQADGYPDGRERSPAGRRLERDADARAGSGGRDRS